MTTPVVRVIKCASVVLTHATPLLFLMMMLNLSTAAEATQPSQVQGLAITQQPAIDGKLDDACWQQGQWSTGFTTITAEPSPAQLQTRFKVGSDHRMLYIAARMEQPADAPLVTRIDQRDGPVWRDDNIEIMIAPTPATGDYIHLVVNASGTVYDALRVQGGQLADRTFDLAVQVATEIQDDHWAVELAIPLADLGLSSSTSTQWAMNIARTSRATRPVEISSFATIAGTLHQPRAFATLQLPRLDATPFQWTLTPRGNARVVSDESQLFLETQVEVSNQTSQYEFFDLQTRLLQDGKILGELNTPRGLDSSVSRLYDLRIPFAGEGQATVAITLHNKRLDMPVHRRQLAVELNYSPLQIHLSAPAYRQSIYDTQTLDAIRGNLVINLPAQALATSKLSIELQSHEGKRIAAANLVSLSANTEFEIPLEQPLAHGDYRVVARLMERDRSTPHEAVIALHRLPAPANGGREVRLNENRVTLVDGKPFLPYGSMMIRPEEDLQAVAKQGYTVVMDYAFYWWKTDQQQAWLDRVHELGMMAVIYPYPEPTMTRDGNPGKPLSEEDSRKIRDFILKWKDHPALLAWYLADEPELHATLPQRLQAVHQLCREADPYHPTILLNNTPGGIDTYGQSCDILMPNPFPGFFLDGGPRRGIRYVHQLVSHANQTLDGSRATWSTPQAFNWADLRKDRPDERIPTFTEVRNMNYQAVIAGSTGTITYAYVRGRRHPSIRLGQAYLASEMQLLKDAVLALDTARTLEFQGSATHILHSYRTAGGHEYLFVVNGSTEAQDVTFTLPAKTKGPWHVVSEGRLIELADGRTLRDTLAPLETRIYTTRKEAADHLSLQRARSGIDQAPTFDDPEQPLPAGEERPATAW